ncbi:MAG: hypothetical protein ACOVQ4_06110 [Flectobacillus sp.]
MFSTGLVLLCFKKTIQEATPINKNDGWIEIKVHLALPYSGDFANLTKHEGLIEYQGEFYNIIEQHYSNDTLYTKIKTNSTAKQRYQSLADDFSLQFSDNHSGKSTPLKKALELCKSLSSSYLQNITPTFTTISDGIHLKIKHQFYDSYIYKNTYASSIFNPPEMASV